MHAGSKLCAAFLAIGLGLCALTAHATVRATWSKLAPQGVGIEGAFDMAAQYLGNGRFLTAFGGSDSAE